MKKTVIEKARALAAPELITDTHIRVDSEDSALVARYWARHFEKFIRGQGSLSSERHFVSKICPTVSSSTEFTLEAKRECLPHVLLAKLELCCSQASYLA